MMFEPNDYVFIYLWVRILCYCFRSCIFGWICSQKITQSQLNFQGKIWEFQPIMTLVIRLLNSESNYMMQPTFCPQGLLEIK